MSDAPLVGNRIALIGAGYAIWESRSAKREARHSNFLGCPGGLAAAWRARVS